MRILIADDEAPARRRMRRLVESLDGHQVIGEARDGDEAARSARQLVPDVVLLDIEMPGMNGLNVARELGALPLPPAIIFVTAYDEHALAAFKSLASGYLLKPIRRADLQAALLRSQRQTRAQHRPRFLNAIVHGQQQRIDLEGILYMTAQDKYTRVVHQEREWLIDDSLRQLEQRLNGFVRIHRACLVPDGRIRGLEQGPEGPVVRLDGCAERLPVSRRCLAAVRKHLAAVE